MRPARRGMGTGSTHAAHSTAAGRAPHGDRARSTADGSPFCSCCAVTIAHLLVSSVDRATRAP
jgi:hypothetical protein